MALTSACAGLTGDAREAVLRVRDTGVGMSEKDILAALEPFLTEGPGQIEANYYAVLASKSTSDHATYLAAAKAFVQAHPTSAWSEDVLNALATALLLVGGLLVLQGRVHAHRRVMLACFGVSIVFLASYVTYHIGKGGVSTPFPQYPPTAVRYFYYAILLSHVVSAAAVPVDTAKAER